MVNATRRRRARQTDVGTVPAPYETLAQVAKEWHARLAAAADRSSGIETFMPMVTVSYAGETILLLIEEENK